MVVADDWPEEAGEDEPVEPFDGAGFVALAALWELETVPAGATDAGVELADVLEELCVLDVPPLTVGWTLIDGWMLIVGWKSIIAIAMAIGPRRPWARWAAGCVGVGVWVWLGRFGGGPRVMRRHRTHVGRAVPDPMVARREQEPAFEVFDHSAKLDRPACWPGTDAIDGFRGRHGPSWARTFYKELVGVRRVSGPIDDETGARCATLGRDWPEVVAATGRRTRIPGEGRSNRVRPAVQRTAALAIHPAVGIGASMVYTVMIAKDQGWARCTEPDVERTA